MEEETPAEKTMRRVGEQYNGNPLARIFVDTLLAQMECEPIDALILQALANPGLLDLLEAGQAKIEAKLKAAKAPAALAATPSIWLPGDAQ